MEWWYQNTIYSTKFQIPKCGQGFNNLLKILINIIQGYFKDKRFLAGPELDLKQLKFENQHAKNWLTLTQTEKLTIFRAQKYKNLSQTHLSWFSTLLPSDICKLQEFTNMWYLDTQTWDRGDTTARLGCPGYSSRLHVTRTSIPFISITKQLKGLLIGSVRNQRG